jgi:hypothetical protein
MGEKEVQIPELVPEIARLQCGLVRVRERFHARERFEEREV